MRYRNVPAAWGGPLGLIILLFSISVYPWRSYAQDTQAPATCTIKAINGNEKAKSGLLKPNQVGYFPRVSNIPPFAKVSIELHYPQGDAGENVVVSVEDGGNIWGRKLQVMPLNTAKKISFLFDVEGDPGIYKLMISKGTDTKVVQLWVGPELR